MKHNVGTADRAVRGGIAVALGYLVLAGKVSGFWAVVLGILGVVMAVTAVTAFCLPYEWFGINTCGCGKHGEKKGP